MLSPGDVVERYEIEALLGSGGMASVYRVRHRTLDTQHALKVLKVKDQNIYRRFIQEGRLQAQLRHPNIVAVTDVLDVDGSPALLMELVVGPTLHEWLYRQRRSLAEVEAVFIGVLQGVGAAHALGFVHRDLKPANILLATIDGKLVPKVTDFGIAKVLDPHGPGPTRTGQNIGTPGYMAPEQIQDMRDVDQRADIFALGSILYEMLAGRPCFGTDSMYAIWHRIQEGVWAPIPDIPTRLNSALQWALAVDREQRIPDCVTFASVMRGVSAQRLLANKTEAPDENVASLPTSSHPAPVAETMVPAPSAPPEPPPSGPPPEPSLLVPTPSQRRLTPVGVGIASVILVMLIGLWVVLRPEPVAAPAEPPVEPPAEPPADPPAEPPADPLVVTPSVEPDPPEEPKANAVDPEPTQAVRSTSARTPPVVMEPVAPPVMGELRVACVGLPCTFAASGAAGQYSLSQKVSKQLPVGNYTVQIGHRYGVRAVTVTVQADRACRFEYKPESDTLTPTRPCEASP